MNKRRLFWLILIGGVLASSGGKVLHASPLTDPVEKAQLPNSNWTFERKEKTEGPAAIMYVKKTGQAVNLRVHTYDVPIASKAFLDQVRTKIMEKPDYAGAEVRIISSKEAGGKMWDVFYIKRKDDIAQEIWARKTDPNVVMMIIYTGAGGLYNDYYNDFSDWLAKSSDWSASGGVGH